MNANLIVRYAVALTGGDGIHAITARKSVAPGTTGTTIISLSMFKGDATSERELAEFAKKVLQIAEGRDVAILAVKVTHMSEHEHEWRTGATHATSGRVLSQWCRCGASRHLEEKWVESK